MFKKMKKEENESQQELNTNEFIQTEITDEEVSSIRDSLESNDSDLETKKFITGFRPNPPPKKSWWDKLDDAHRFHGGNLLVSKSDKSKICKVCCPGTTPGTYAVKFNETRDEITIIGKLFMLAPENTTYIPYMDEYTKWKYNRDLQKNKKS
jgi:hypothetical protein